MSITTTELNPGTGGSKIAVDRIPVGSPVVNQDRQLIKIEWGPAGTVNMADDADGSRLPVKEAKAGTGTDTQVAASATAVQIVASNANRKGVYIHNTSSANLYLRLGTTDPTTSDFTTIVPQDQTFRDEKYTGQIKGIWTSAAGGNANVTELT